MDYNTIFENEYNKLNEQQRQAVESLYGPIMVVAGPGTGKTQIIGMRTANIILKAWVNPENILITTFTDAWVIAIRERLLRFLWNEAYKVQVSTIHSLSQDIIKTFPEKFIEYKAGTPIDEVESLELLKSIIDDLYEKKLLENLVTDYDKYFYLRDIKSRIGNLKGEWVSLQRFKKLIEKQAQSYEEELAEIKPTLKKYETTKQKQEKHIAKLNELWLLFDAYNKALRQQSQYDFNDMINFVLEKFQNDEELKHHYAELFQFIMLDEYQDTNNAQNMIINEILSVTQDTPNIMVVGDDDQSIYRFQWANIENMLDFSTHFSNTQFIVLEHNYRSTQGILDFSSTLIDNNEERLSKKITSINKQLMASWKYKESKLIPKLIKAASDIEERAIIIQHIQKLLHSWESPQEIAIIVRGNREVIEWTTLLQQNNIEAESKLKSNILESQYVNFILKYLEVIENPYADENKLLDILRAKITGLHPIDIIKINRKLYIENYSRKYKLKIADFLMDEAILNELWLFDKQALINFRDRLFDFSREVWSTSVSDFFQKFIEKNQIMEHIESQWSFDDIQDVYTLFNTIKTWNRNNKEMKISDILSKIDLYKTYNYPIARQILKKSTPWIQVLTAHGSKGLEYNVVFIPWLYTGNWEGKRVIDRLKLPDSIAWEGLQESKFKQIEEDRRLFFVAATRAKQELYLSYPAGVGTKPLLQSSFVEETTGYFEDYEIQQNWEQSWITTEIIRNDIQGNMIEYTQLEFDYIQEFLENYKLSPSDLNVFLENPLDFLHRVIFKYPFIDNKYTIFGKVYHRTLELFYLKYKKENTLPEKIYLTNTFLALLNQEILTPEEQEQLQEKWVQGLEWYYDLYAQQAKQPLALEYSLRRKNIEFQWVPLTGTIDKIESIWTAKNDITQQEGQMAFFKESVALIDYKTGSVKAPWVIKWVDRYGNKKPGEGKYFRQLLFYKLLCEQDYEFNGQFDVWSLALDFVEGKDGNYKYIEIEYTNEEYEIFKNELLDSRSKIKDINFWKELLQ